MAKYHKYVFDIENRKFIGEFEKMYQNETKEIFDSWYQDDTRQLQRKIDLAILEEYNFNIVIDIGCGKGCFTHFLKKKNNKVIGIDISKTAISFAKERYSDIDFVVSDVNNINNYIDITKKMGEIELVFSSEVFSYIDNWRELLHAISKTSKYFMISLFIPENPIGFVKSENDLVSEIEKNFEIIEHISIRKSQFVIVFAKSKLLS